MQRQFWRHLASEVEARDGTTSDQCHRLVEMGTKFARYLGLTLIEEVIMGKEGILHDIGKIAVPDAVLLKNGPL